MVESQIKVIVINYIVQRILESVDFIRSGQFARFRSPEFEWGIEFRVGSNQSDSGGSSQRPDAFWVRPTLTGPDLIIPGS